MALPATYTSDTHEPFLLLSTATGYLLSSEVWCRLHSNANTLLTRCCTQICKTPLCGKCASQLDPT